MRQKDDLNFAAALNNLAKDNLSHTDINLLENRCKSISQIPKEILHLFPTNAEVDKYNVMILNTLDTEGFVSLAEDHCNDQSKSVRTKALDTMKNYTKDKTYGLPLEILFKVSAKYMITCNIDVDDGLVNGATGTLRHITYKKDKITPSRLWIEFDDTRVGTNVRKKNKNFMSIHGINENCTPIERMTRSIQVGRKSTLIKVTRRQFPLVPSSAITIHKSQGDTYDKVAVHIGKRKISRRMLYVAMSRAKSADGLYIVSDRFPQISPINDNDTIVAELKRLHKYSSLEI